jgi:hypothetical protein
MTIEKDKIIEEATNKGWSIKLINEVYKKALQSSEQKHKDFIKRLKEYLRYTQDFQHKDIIAMVDKLKEQYQND